MSSPKHTNRKTKEIEYQKNYGHIPLDYRERLNYMVDLYGLSEEKMQEIYETKINIQSNIFYYDLNIVSLYEEPEGTGRPRFRIINRKNFHNEAVNNSEFVHVYTLGAKDDFLYMKRMVEEELIPLEGLINTPVNIEYYAYFKTPSYYNVNQTFMAEIGLDRPSFKKPDWDNIGKKYCDMYNHNVWLDDVTVIDGAVHKYFSILPRVEIKLRYLNTVYNRHQYTNILKRKDYDGTPIHYLNAKGELI